MTDFKTYFKALSVNEELGLVLGWGIVCTEKGEPYFDLQNDHIPEQTMLKSVTDFMINSRAAKEMHVRAGAGSVIHAFPLTKDIAKAFGISCETTGWMVAVKPDEEMLEGFKSGRLTGFSIGGVRGKDKIVEE